MDREPFNAAVSRIRAEQFFQEKAASAPAVSAVKIANLARAGEVEDPELLKLASVYCPKAPLAFYEKLGGKFKVAEPPPPKGVSAKKWDEILGGKTAALSEDLALGAKALKPVAMAAVPLAAFGLGHRLGMKHGGGKAFPELDERKQQA
jgi:hypothetical protein